MKRSRSAAQACQSARRARLNHPVVKRRCRVPHPELVRSNLRRAYRHRDPSRIYSEAFEQLLEYWTVHRRGRIMPKWAGCSSGRMSALRKADIAEQWPT